MTITISAWVIPLVITIVFMLIIPLMVGDGHPLDFTPLLAFLGGVIVSLAAWLIWALL